MDPDRKHHTVGPYNRTERKGGASGGKVSGPPTTPEDRRRMAKTIDDAEYNRKEQERLRLEKAGLKPVDGSKSIFLKVREEKAPQEPDNGPTFVRASVMGQGPEQPAKQPSQQGTGSSWVTAVTSPAVTQQARKDKGDGKAILRLRRTSGAGRKPSSNAMDGMSASTGSPDRIPTPPGPADDGHVPVPTRMTRKKSFLADTVPVGKPLTNVDTFGVIGDRRVR